MRSISILLCLLGITSDVFSQDTIQFINKPAQAVKVIEIGIAEIKYQRFDNLGGPLYVADKNEIRYIKYSNGHVDSVTIAGKVKAATPETFTVYRSTGNVSDNEKILIDGSRLSYKKKAVGEARLFQLISTVPNPEKKAMLLKEYDTMKSYKKKQYLFGFGGLGAGVALLWAGGITSVFVEEEDLAVGLGFLAGAGVGITGEVYSIINKRKRTKQKIQIANLYNN